jgi:hypothetical protein
MLRNYGLQTPVVSLAAHVAYGTIIALFSPWPADAGVLFSH